MNFKKAERRNINIRFAICGPTGSGKTFTAIGIASEIAKAIGGRVAVIDTERSSADRYADKFDFDACQLSCFSPEDYMSAINDAADAGYPVLVIDSLSHSWDGQDGLLERVDMLSSSGKGSSFNAWGKVTPIYRRLVDRILTYPGHVIVTMRSKMEYIQEKNESTGKTTIRKVGMAPVQRQGIEYEFDLVGDMDQEHVLILTKSRAAELSDKMFPKPGKKFAMDVLAWSRGPAPTPSAAPVAPKVEKPVETKPVEPKTAEKPVETKPVQPPVQSKTAADLGKEIAEKLTKINALTIKTTGAKNRAEVLREVSSLAGRTITGLAQLAGQEADDVLEVLECAEQMEDDPASRDTYLATVRDAAAAHAPVQGVLS